jgi:uncharacterized protein YneF (UPF0154 family)
MNRWITIMFVFSIVVLLWIIGWAMYFTGSKHAQKTLKENTLADKEIVKLVCSELIYNS